MSTAEWVVAGAAIFTGAATSVAATVTARMARETKEVAKATKQTAEATRDAAEASADEAKATTAVVEEARRDRDLQWRPVLAASNAPGLPAWAISNAGAGPAIGCRLAVRDERGGWAMTLPLDIAPGASESHLVPQRQGAAAIDHLFAPPAAAQQPYTTEVLARG